MIGGQVDRLRLTLEGCAGKQLFELRKTPLKLRHGSSEVRQQHIQLELAKLLAALVPSLQSFKQCGRLALETAPLMAQLPDFAAVRQRCVKGRAELSEELDLLSGDCLRVLTRLALLRR